MLTNFSLCEVAMIRSRKPIREALMSFQGYQLCRRLPLAVPTIIIAGTFNFVFDNFAMAQQNSSLIKVGPYGVQHIFYLAVKSDPDSQNFEQSDDGSATAALMVTMRISAHSRETNFFGNVRAAVANFDPIRGSPEKEVWRDAKCHHERGGFPKISVLYVDGLISKGQTKRVINARYRQIGLPLPSDEQSRLFVDLKLHIVPCDLKTGALLTSSMLKEQVGLAAQDATEVKR